MKTPTRHLPFLAALGCLLAAAGGLWGGGFAASSAAPPAAAAPTPRLEDLQLTGVLALDGAVRVCLLDTAGGRAAWLVVGEAGAGVLAEAYDPAREAVLVRAGGGSRWIGLRAGSITDLPVARLGDGSVDWFHMRLSEKEKEREANLLMWDILEVGRLARLGQMPPPGGSPPQH